MIDLNFGCFEIVYSCFPDFTVNPQLFVTSIYFCVVRGSKLTGSLLGGPPDQGVACFLGVSVDPPLIPPAVAADMIKSAVASFSCAFPPVVGAARVVFIILCGFCCHLWGSFMFLLSRHYVSGLHFCDPVVTGPLYCPALP